MVAFRFGRIVFLPMMIVLAIFCVQTNRPQTITDSPHPGMRKIAASGKTFLMGTNDSLANYDEKPAMPVTFSYDYWIDTTEVTQGNYQSIMGSNPVPDTSAYGKGALNPVYYVSWFDAALFCNARSKKVHLDTVYSYYSISQNPGGSVYNLVGLRIHYDKDGIRLPTEAEWEFVARGGSSNQPFTAPSDSALASTCAWYIRNSNGMSRVTATKVPNALGLYDLAGNVFEWTGDWKGPHIAKPVVDPIGAENQNQQFERVLKGGSFENDLYNLRPTCRSATYPTAAFSSCEYVGFRCARGIIPNPAFVSQDSTLISTNPVDMVISDMRPLAGTAVAKLVFVNVSNQVRTVCYIDYSEPHPQIYEFADMQDAYLPTISPDGRYVAFCTQNAGFGDTSHIWIRSLDSLHSPLARLNTDFAYMPRWWVNGSTGDTFLVYTNSSIDNSLPAWSSTSTFLQRMIGGKPAGAPSTLIPDKSFHDGISANGQFAATGFTRLLMRNLSSGEQRQLFVSPLNGKSSTGSTQVCNVSICPDTSHNDRCMFLDFGSTNSTLTHCPYSAHQFIFVADFSGNVISWFKYPDGEDSWDFPKWSTQEQFAVACARNSSSESHAIYFLNLLQNQCQEIVSGIEIENPFLWINNISGISSELDVDSLGRYDDPPVYVFQDQTASKMELFWANYHDLEFVFLGSSQTTNGIDCSQFTGYRVLNMGYAAGGLLGLTTIVRQYILPNCPKIKVIGFSATPYWLNEINGDVSWNAGIAQSKGYTYDLHHNFWKPGKPPGFDSLIAPGYYGYYACGIADPAGNPCQGWGGDTPPNEYNDTFTLNDQEVINNFDTLEAFISELNALHIQFLVINFPESPAYKNTSFYSASGLSWQTGEAVMQKFKSFEQAYQYYHFYDAYNNGNHDYADSEAFNASHLCSKGAAKLSHRLDSLINTFLTP
jgi:uncharacterized protein (TIGR02171 family)